MIVLYAVLGYLAVGIAFARDAYRHTYAKIYGAPAPRSYGGKIGHGRASEVAMREARPWIVMWSLYLAWDGLDRLITGSKPVQTKIDELEEEMRRDLFPDPNEARRAEGLPEFTESVAHTVKPVKPCPCGYTIECAIHCGDGSCHERMAETGKILLAPVNAEQLYDPWLWEGHPKKIRYPMDPLPHCATLAETSECGCPKCTPHMYLWE